MNPARLPSGFSPIGSYALLGDGRTVALVALDGSLDWLPIPAMDSPPAFDRLLTGGSESCFELAPARYDAVRRRYREDTAVLETTYETPDGVVTVVDSMNREGRSPLPWVEIARVVESDAEVPMRWRIAPGRRFGQAEPWAWRRDGSTLIQLADQTLAVVTSGAGDPNVATHAVTGSFVTEPGARAVVALLATDGEPIPGPDPQDILQRVQATTDGWRTWRRSVQYDGPGSEAVLRSALTLKLLTLDTNGANMAAATTSLPEVVGGSRNFDYRFCWVRDAAFALDALCGLGLQVEVHRSLSWLLDAVARTAPDVHVFYTVGGEPAPGTMEEVGSVSGYLHTRPVHVGNSAATQRQLGAYGHVMDAAWHYVEAGGQLDVRTGSMFAELADRACDLWRLPDAGIWELGSYEQYTSSKVGCWVAVDRAVRFAERGQITSVHVERWKAVREEIHSYVDEHCWSDAKQSYTMHAGTSDLDASVLLMARTGFRPEGDPRLTSTVDAIAAELSAGDPLLFRYSEMKGKEGAFAACTYWLVEALVHCGRMEEARQRFDAMLAHCNDVGLLSEEVDPTTGDLLGNFPQGLSHLALIGAAKALAGAR